MVNWKPPRSRPGFRNSVALGGATKVRRSTDRQIFSKDEDMWGKLSGYLVLHAIKICVNLVEERANYART